MIFQSTLRRVLFGLLVVDIVIAITALAAISTLRLNGSQLLIVQSASMVPALQKGDLLITDPIKDQRFVRGEIVSYRLATDPNVIVSHRLVDIDRSKHKLVTAGDALNSRDQPIAESQVIGRARYLLPGFGRFLSILRRPLVLAVVIYLPAVILLYIELVRVIRHLRTPRYQLQTRR